MCAFSTQIGEIYRELFKKRSPIFCMKKRTQRILTLVSLEFVVTAVIFLLALFTFSFIIHEVLYEQEDVFDNQVIHFFATHSSPGLIALMEKITFFGSTTFLFPAYIVLIAWHLVRKTFAYAIDIAVIAISSTAMMFGLKQFFHRHRPQLPILKGISGYSFPSGHSLSSFVFCTILIYLVWKSTVQTGYKMALTLLLVLCPLVIGLSRIILNVHYATDVIGGFCLAIVWVILSFIVLQKIRKRKPAVRNEAG
jgi:undecaprenyl-diphosphatase